MGHDFARYVQDKVDDYEEELNKIHSMLDKVI